MTLPTNISDLAAWLLLPAVLGMLATLVVSAAVSLFGSAVTPQVQTGIKFATFIVVGIASYLLTQVPPDVLASFQPFFVVMMSVLAAFLGNGALHILNNVTLRLLLGGTEFRAQYNKTTIHPAL